MLQCLSPFYLHFHTHFSNFVSHFFLTSHKYHELNGAMGIFFFGVIILILESKTISLTLIRHVDSKPSTNAAAYEYSVKPVTVICVLVCYPWSLAVWEAVLNQKGLGDWPHHITGADSLSTVQLPFRRHGADRTVITLPWKCVQVKILAGFVWYFFLLSPRVPLIAC